MRLVELFAVLLKPSFGHFLHIDKIYSAIRRLLHVYYDSDHRLDDVEIKFDYLPKLIKSNKYINQRDLSLIINRNSN